MAAANGVIQIPIPTFLGINQASTDMSLQYAAHAENVDTSDGRWRTAKGAELYNSSSFFRFPDVSRIDKAIRYKMPESFGTNAYRWIVFYDGTVYVSDPSSGGGQSAFRAITYPDETPFTYVTGDQIDYVIYSDSFGEGYDPEPVVIFSGKKTGCFEIWLDFINPLGYPVVDDEKDPKYYFSSICQYKERIFGIGEDDNGNWNRIYYSQPFNPNDFSQIAGNPEESGGTIDYPTWDGDNFISLSPFGGYLVAFKRHHAVIISGAYPGEFNVTESYGTNGAVADNTVQVGDGVIFFLSDHGIGIFDGGMIRNITRDVIGDIMDNIDFSRSTAFSSIYYNGVYSVSVRTIKAPKYGGADIKNEVIEYDYVRGTFMLRTGLKVDGFVNCAEEGVCVVAGGIPMSGTTGSCIGLWNKGDYYFVPEKPIRSAWESPWTDCGHKESTKSGFRIRCQCEGPEDGSGNPTGILKFTMETERKKKEKWLKAASATATKRKMVAKNVSNRGRQFRFIMQNLDDREGVSPVVYRPISIDTGLQIEVELDSD